VVCFCFQTNLLFLLVKNNYFQKAHGTYIGNIRLESSKPQQVFVDSQVKGLEHITTCYWPPLLVIEFEPKEIRIIIAMTLTFKNTQS
jgi:hypothetical protein